MTDYVLLFSEASDSLSWASAQIHCQCSVSESRVFLPKALHLSTEDINTSGKVHVCVSILKFMRFFRTEAAFCIDPELAPALSHS